MRFARLSTAGTLLALIGWGWLWLHPYYPPHEDVVLALYDTVSRGHLLFTISSPFLWGLLPLVVLLLWFLLQSTLRTGPTVRTTYGSAAYMRGIHARQRYGQQKQPLRLRLPALHLGKRRLFSRGARSSAPAPATLMLGTFQSVAIRLGERDQTENIILTAPVGAGKTSVIIVPNLLNEPGTRSLLVPDVKSELYRLTAGQVSQRHEIWRFAPAQATESLGYNPLAYIRGYEDAQELAHCWIENTGKSKDDFWPNAATKLLASTLMHLRVAEPAAPFSRVADILCGLSFEELQLLFQQSPSVEAREELASFFEYMGKNDKLVGALMTDIGTRFQLVRSVADVTARNDIDFRVMSERPIALYLSIPRRYAARYQPLLACFLMQAFLTWEEVAETSPGGRLPQTIIAYLDEFTNLGYIPNFSTYITTARHTRIALLLALQSFHQLDERYGRSVRETILANCKTHLLLPGAGLSECEYYSERIGDTTVQTTASARSRSGTAAWAASTYTTSWNTSETRRRLMTPEELRTLPPDKMLVLGASEAPLLVQTHPYFKNRQLARRVNLPIVRVQVSEETSVSPDAPTLAGDSGAPGASARIVNAAPDQHWHDDSPEEEWGG